jgi:hypothetical protein
VRHASASSRSREGALDALVAAPYYRPVSTGQIAEQLVGGAWAARKNGLIP